MATIFTAVFIALIVLFNFGVTVLVEKNPLRIDVTDNALFSFTDETVNYLENLDQEIEITILAKEEEFIAYGDETSQLYYQYGIDVLSHMPKVNEMIKRYSQYSSNISVNYVDILEDPNFVAKYPNDKLAQGQIIVSSSSSESSPSIAMISSMVVPRTAARTMKLSTDGRLIPFCQL